MTLAQPSAEAPILDRDYWVANSVGYRVHGGVKTIGFVEATHDDPERPGSTLLTLRLGVLGRRSAVVRSDDVAMIAPRAERLWLHTGAPASP